VCLHGAVKSSKAFDTVTWVTASAETAHYNDRGSFPSLAAAKMAMATPFKKRPTVMEGCLFGVVVSGEDQRRDDGGKGIALEAAHQLKPGLTHAIRVDEQQAGMPTEHDGFDLRGVRVDLEGKAPPQGPLTHQVRDRLPDRPEEQNGRTSPHPVVLRKSLC